MANRIKNINFDDKKKYDPNQYFSLQAFNKLSQNQKDFIILQINARSLIKNFNKLEELLISLVSAPDIIAISETKLKDNIPFPYELKNYNFVHVNSPTNAGGVGICIKTLY